MLTCLLVDDERPARQRLRRMLEEAGGVEIVGEAGDGVSALEQLSALAPDVVFLDIEMPELDGLGVAAALPQDGPAIVFITAYDEHALRAFELCATDYLVKPVSRERLEAALRRIAARKPKPVDVAKLLSRLGAVKPSGRMALRCGGKYLVFDPSRVSAIVSRDHYSAILVDGEELLSEDSLDELERRFDPEQFLRVHRGGLIHLAFLRELVHEGDRKYVAVMNDAEQTRVPISRDRLPQLKARLGLKP